MSEHPFGWLSLLPPVVAIVLAIATRRVIPSLLAGIFAGALVTRGGNAWTALTDTLEVHLWQTLIDPERLRVYSFTLLMGAMVGVIIRCGGMHGLIRMISPIARTRRSGQLVTWFLGLLVFFDDYANTMLLGNTLRPLADKLRISREKLAYIVDSTAAPVAGLAVISTWIAVELAFLQDGIANVRSANGLQPLDLFIATIPYRFYVLMALLFVPMVAILGREFGPMLVAERQSLDRGEVDPMHLSPSTQGGWDHDPNVPARWFNAFLPIAVTLGLVLVLLYTSGLARAEARGGDELPDLRTIIGAANSSFALQYGSLAGLATAILLAWGQRLLTMEKIGQAAGWGARVVLPALMILWFASSMSTMTGNKSAGGDPETVAFEFSGNRLYTGDFLLESLSGAADPETGAVQQRFPVEFLPTVVFVLACVISFSTGTSYGTMGILLPIVIPLACSMLSLQPEGADPDSPLLLCTVGSVLAGAIFGDHCSPISDTTILSSQSSGCNHIAHVWTQLPYALTVGVVVILFGTLPAGYGISVWILLPMQFAAMVAILLLFGKPVDQEGRRNRFHLQTVEKGT